MDLGLGKDPLTRVIVREAAHPRYVVQCKGGDKRSVNADDRDTAMFPKVVKDPERDMDLDKCEEFRQWRRDMAKDGELGSFGVLMDSQVHALRRIQEEKRYAKAVKADDAEVPLHLWNDRVTIPGFSDKRRDAALAAIRRVAHKLFLRTVRRDCWRHMADEHGPDWTRRPRLSKEGKVTHLGRDQHAVCSIIWHAAHSDWFEYKCGSRLVYFRFPPRYRKVARDGVPAFVEREVPRVESAQRVIADPERRAKVRSKLEKVLSRRYVLTTGLRVCSYIRYFDVPKGDKDVRIVYDGTANGLNHCVWVPSFWLPTLDSLLRVLDGRSWMTDRDVADMFLNYQLHRSLAPYTGIDLAPLCASEEEGGPRKGYWDRLTMGLSPSPYNAVKMALVVEEVARGNRRETGVGADGKELNPFQWDRVRLNLPGLADYDPALAWLSKLRLDGLVACDLLTFVDDERIAAPTRELAWEAGHRLAAVQAYLGVQDASRKARPCSQTPGAWAGVVVHVMEGLGVCTLASEDKWSKLKSLLQKWWDRLAAGETKLAHKELLSDRGFLVYVTRTYPAMVPYLKGFHLSAETWRGGRDVDGYRTETGDTDTVASDDTSVGGTDLRCHLGGSAPCPVAHAPPDDLTTAVPRLKHDVAALRRLAAFDLPPLRVVRPSRVVQVFYGFGDASGTQFGATTSQNYNCRGCLSKESAGSKGVRFRLGIWAADVQRESSNYKELRNLVETAEAEAKAGRLHNCEFFLFTDSSTAELAFHKGSSTSPLLHELVLRLRLLEMTHSLLVHLIHVSGSRMIAQGTDGCSRGSLMEGVMAGFDMLSFVDLARTALQRCLGLLDWLRAWTGRPALKALTPEGWFDEGHGVTGWAKDAHGVWMPKHGPRWQLFLWAPPPAVADAALEELLKARHKRTDTFHVVVIPRLMLPRWRRLFLKVCDFTFELSPKFSFWPPAMYEPLWVGVVLPFTHHRPWCLKRAPVLVEIGVRLREVLASGQGDGRDLLRKLLSLPERLAAVSDGVARGMLHVPGGRHLPCQEGAG